MKKLMAKGIIPEIRPISDSKKVKKSFVSEYQKVIK